MVFFNKIVKRKNRTEDLRNEINYEKVVSAICDLIKQRDAAKVQFPGQEFIGALEDVIRMDIEALASCGFSGEQIMKDIEDRGAIL